MANQEQSTPKATLYVSKGSLWASVPQLGLIEKGYTPNEYNLKTVDLFKGENLCPEFLKLNPKGTIPLLVVPLIHAEPDHPQKYKSLTDSTQILEFLDVSRKPHTNHHTANDNPAPTLSPAIISSKMESDKIIELVHDEVHNLNFLMFGCLNSKEVDQKGAEGAPMRLFVENRIKALEKYLNENPTSTTATKAFWDDRLLSDRKTMKIFSKSATPEVAAEFFKRTKTVWENTILMLGITVRAISSHNGGYILGEQISLVDIHVGAWLARLFKILGHTDSPSSSHENASELKLHERLQCVLKSIRDFSFEGNQLEKVCGGIEKYWSLLSARESFKQVYADGLH